MGVIVEAGGKDSVAVFAGLGGGAADEGDSSAGGAGHNTHLALEVQADLAAEHGVGARLSSLAAEATADGEDEAVEEKLPLLIGSAGGAERVYPVVLGVVAGDQVRAVAVDGR